MRMKSMGATVVMTLLVASSVAQISNEHQDHLMRTAEEMNWLPLRGGYPLGAQVSVLYGNPAQVGVPFALALKMPDGYRVPPHWHPGELQFSVVQGIVGMGVGEQFDTTNGRELPAGSYMKLAKEVRHFEWSIGETIVHLYGVGPTGITYVNPADDPRSQAK